MEINLISSKGSSQIHILNYQRSYCEDESHEGKTLVKIWVKWECINTDRLRAHWSETKRRWNRRDRLSHLHHIMLNVSYIFQLRSDHKNWTQTLCCVCWICLVKMIHLKCQAISQPQGKLTPWNCSGINYITLTSLNSTQLSSPQLKSWPETHYLSNGTAVTDGSGCWQALHILQTLHSPGPHDH